MTFIFVRRSLQTLAGPGTQARRFHKGQGQCGQGMTEYLIVVALIAVSAIAITSTTGQHIKVGFAKIASSLQGRTTNETYRGVTRTQVQTRDMGDFSQGATTRSR